MCKLFSRRVGSKNMILLRNLAARSPKTRYDPMVCWTRGIREADRISSGSEPVSRNFACADVATGSGAGDQCLRQRYWRPHQPCPEDLRSAVHGLYPARELHLFRGDTPGAQHLWYL